VIANLHKYALKARHSYLEILALEGPIAFDAMDEFHRLSSVLDLDRIAEMIQWLADRLEMDPFRHLRVDGPYRRRNTGTPARPWIDQVRKDLTAAAVPDDPEDSLLVAVALVPYRPVAQSRKSRGELSA
jgi:hypothetical protein